MKTNNKKRFPVFLCCYLIYTALLIFSVCFGLRLLWRFLSVYEATRPVHAMESAISLLTPEKEASLCTYVTNTTENPYEDNSVIRTLFYEMTAGKKLTFGKLSGAYSEARPTFAVLAGDTHVATFSFRQQNDPGEFGLYGWDLDTVTLLVSPKHSFALTLPSSMRVFINQQPIAADAVLATREAEGLVSYTDYACSGLYAKPNIEVFDRYGAPVTLTYDEASGGYYYPLSYVTAPDNLQITVGSHRLGEEHLLEDNLPIEELGFLSQLSSRFSEYKDLPQQISIPHIHKYYIDFAYTGDSVICKNRLGELLPLSYDESTRMYSHAPVSEASVHDACVSFATSFLELYAKFCARDALKTELIPYFPPNSEYYELIASLDNEWYNSHSNLSFQNHTEQEFFAYSDSLAYVHITFEQKMKLRATGKYVVYPIDIPVWLVKIDGSWYIARIVFDYFTTE